MRTHRIHRLLFASFVVALLAAAAPASAQVGPGIFAPNNDGTSNANLFRLFAKDFEQIKAAIAGCGVDKTSYDADGTLVSAQASPDMSVHVDAGNLRCAGAIVGVSADDLAVTAANPTQTRIDLVVADGGDGSLSVITGTAAANPVAPDIPADHVLLARVVVTPGVTAITDALLVDKRLPVSASAGGGGSALPGVFLLSDYGAVGDGVTDDTDAINDAFADASAEIGGTVVAGCDKTYWFDDTLILGSTVAGTDSFVNLAGCGPNSTRFEWHGSTSGVAIRLARVKFSRLEGFTLTNDVAVGTTKGMVLGGNTASYGGTQTLANGLRDIIVSGFDVGIDFGGFNGAASENLMERVSFYTNDTGWTSSDGNSLNNTAQMISCDGNGVCGAGGAGSGLSVIGGSGSNSTIADFTCTQTHAACTIQGWRSEVGKRFFVANGSAMSVTLIGNESISMDDDIAVELAGSASSATLIGNRFQDSVSIGSYYGSSLTMTNNLVVTSTAYPFEPQALGDQSAHGVMLSLRGNYDFVNSGSRLMLDDLEGTLRHGYASGTYPVVVTATARVNRDEQFSGTPFRPAQVLNNTQAVGQGGAVVGKNLSYHVTFATSAAAQVDFTRNVTIDAPGNPYDTVTVTSGDLTIGDLGRRITVASGGDYAPAFIGTIQTRVSATSFTLLGLSWYYGECGSCSTVTAVVGEDEPDANYLVQFACNANENFWWSAKATTGFQMNSSNASSTAECDVLIHR